MKRTALPLLPRGPIHDLLLRPAQIPLPPAEINFDADVTAHLHHDFLLQNSRPDLVSLKNPDRALRALDLP